MSKKPTGKSAVKSKAKPSAPKPTSSTAARKHAKKPAAAKPVAVKPVVAKPVDVKAASVKPVAVKPLDDKPVLPEEKPKALPRSAAKFKIGDHLVYPFHGVGVVTVIEKLKITEEEQWYYTLNFRNGELIVKLPISKQEDKGMRRVIHKADVEKVIAVLKKKLPSEEADWKVRHNLYLEKLKSGDIYEAAKVARNLSKRGPEGELSMSEKRLLEAAIQQLVQEIAEASHEPIEKVETEISKLLRAGRT